MFGQNGSPTGLDYRGPSPGTPQRRTAATTLKTAPEVVGAAQPNATGMPAAFGLFDGALPQNIGPNMPGMLGMSAEAQQRALERGPTSHSRFLGGFSFTFAYIILFFLLAASTVLAALEALDAIAIGFRRPLIPLIMHIVLFLLFMLFSLWRASSFMLERILEDRLQVPVIGALFSLLHLVGMVVFIIWTAKYGSANQRVEFGNEPVGLIALTAVSATMFVWYGVCIMAWVLLCVIRYNHNKMVETVAIITQGRIPQIMSEAAKASDPR